MSTPKRGPGGKFLPKAPEKAPKMAQAKKPRASGEVTARAATSLRANVQMRHVVEVDREVVGAMLLGFLQELNSTSDGTLTEYFPPGADGQATDADRKTWDRLADEREIGREMARGLGYAATHLRVTSAQWAAGFARALDAARTSGAMSGTQAGGLRPPLPSPTVVTSPYGVQRAEGFHRGVDLRADVGTPVAAPAAARVDKIWTEDAGGLCLRLSLQRPDGGYAAEATTDDDTGLLVTFAHLADTVAREGDVVQAGDVVAHTGASGRVSGPHLHVIVELFTDAPFFSTQTNAREFVDPALVWGGTERLTGAAAPGFPSTGAVGQALAVDRVSGAQTPHSVVINNSGTMSVVGQGVQIQTRVLLPLSGSGDGGYDNAPVPDALRARVPAGADVLPGLGGLAGMLFAQLPGQNGGEGPVALLGSVIQQGGSAIGAVTRFVGSVAGPVASVVGPVATFVAPFLNAIPVVGQVASGVAGGVGIAASAAAPFLGALGPMAGAGVGALQTGVSAGVGAFLGARPSVPASGQALNVPAFGQGLNVPAFGQGLNPAPQQAQNPGFTPV